MQFARTLIRFCKSFQGCSHHHGPGFIKRFQCGFYNIIGLNGICRNMIQFSDTRVFVIPHPDSIPLTPFHNIPGQISLLQICGIFRMIVLEIQLRYQRVTTGNIDAIHYIQRYVAIIQGQYTTEIIGFFGKYNVV